MTRTRVALILLVGLGVLGALGILSSRWAVEARSRTVEIALDGPDWEALARREGRDPAEVFAEAARRGATSVALYEWTLKRLAEHGLAVYASGEELAAQARFGALPAAFAALGTIREQIPPGTVYVAATPPTSAFISEALVGLLGHERVHSVGGVLKVRGLRDDLEEMGLGFRAEDLAQVRAAGLEPVLRLRNIPGLTPQGLTSIGTRLKALGSGYPVVFELTEVLGYERLIPETAALLREAGDRYARIEVFNVKRKQRGDDRFAQEMRHDIIRLFSLTPEELLVLPQAEARDKFVRGARERNIRLLYLRPFPPTAGVVGTESNLAFVASLAADLRRFSLSPGRAVPLPDVGSHRLTRLIASIGTLGVIALALALLGDAVGAPIPPLWLWGLTGSGALLTAGLLTAGPLVLWLKLLALGGASLLPAVAIAVAIPRRPGGSPVLQGMRTLWLATAVSMATGLLVAALLTRWEFMMAADVFLGVKVAQVVPVILVVLFLWRQEETPRAWRNTVRELWEWSAHPLLLRYAIAVVLAGLAAVILLARSGNFGLPVLSVEERLRNLLEDWLVARPRTKEYLIGHPALLLAGAAAAVGWRRWVAWLAAVGAVGQAGIVNSFSHIHTPLLYVAWRTVNALWLGTLLGMLAVGIIAAVAARISPRSTPARRSGSGQGS